MKLDREASKNNVEGKVSKKKRSKVGKVIIATALGVVIVYGSFFFGYKYQPDMSNKSLSNSVQAISAESVIDDAFILDSYSEAVNSVEQMEKYLNLIQTFKGLHLSKYNEGLMPFDVSSLTVEDVQLLIKQYQELEQKVDMKTPNQETQRFYEIVGKLSSYEANMSADYIRMNINNINRYADGIIKGITIDAVGLDFASIDYLTTNLEDTDSKFVVKYKDPVSGKEFELNTSAFNNLNNLINDVRRLNEMVNPKPNDKGEVKEYSDQEIEELAARIINECKIAEAYSYNASRGTIKQEGNNYTKGFLF